MGQGIVTRRENKSLTNISEISSEDLPALIHDQVHQLNELDESVKEALELAENANRSASSARNRSAGFGRKKAAIEHLQSAGYDLAKAVESGAIAQKISFEFQTKLAEISKYLFGLGASNIASNRFVVRELELKLKGASEEELSELARQELITVVKQLKEQEDLLNKIENVSQIVKEQEQLLKIQANKNIDIDKQFEQHAKTDSLHNKQLKKHAETDDKLAKQLQSQATKINKHDNQLKEHEAVHKNYSKILKDHAETDEQIKKKLLKQSNDFAEQTDTFYDYLEDHEEQLSELHKTNLYLSNEIIANTDLIEIQEKEIKNLNDEINDLKTELDTKGSKTMSWVNFSLSLSTLILLVVHFFI